MAEGDIVSVQSRRATPEEKALVAWMAEQEKKSIDNIEAMAREIIQLVGAFYGIVFGILALGSNRLEASLAEGAVVGLGIATIFAFLIALIAALVAIAPLRYRYQSANLAQKKALYAKLLTRKSQSLLVAVICFGIGIIAFAALIVVMLLMRVA